MFLYVALLCCFWTNNHGFLLDNNPGNPDSQTGNQYLTIDDKIQMHHDLENLRLEQEKALNILTTQLQQKLAEIDKQLHNKDNNTCYQTISELENKVRDLEQNYSNLSIFTEAKMVQQADLIIMMNKTIQFLIGRVQQIDVINDNYRKLEAKNNVTLTDLKNQTANIGQKLAEINNLKGIQDLTEFSSLKQEVKRLETLANNLKSHEQARNDDFLALYNTTKESLSQLLSKSAETNGSIYAMNGELNRTITHVAALKSEMDSKLQNITDTLALRSNETVGFTLKYQGGITKEGIPNAREITTAVGITHLDELRTGRFICSSPGLYFISATMMADKRDDYFYIYVNSKRIGQMFLGEIQSLYREATYIILYNLQKGDTVYVKAMRSNCNVYEHSTFTVLKII